MLHVWEGGMRKGAFGGAGVQLVGGQYPSVRTIYVQSGQR
jgi:hypothetical protein